MGTIPKFTSTLNEISLKHKTSIANIASKFVLNNKNVSSVIIGARIGESSHIEDHKNLLEVSLDKDDINKIEGKIKMLKPFLEIAEMNIAHLLF